jgi:hypothetical protein
MRRDTTTFFSEEHNQDSVYFGALKTRAEAEHNAAVGDFPSGLT